MLTAAAGSGTARRRLVLRVKHERMIEYLAEKIPARGVLPEDCYGLGSDKLNEQLRLAWLSDDRGFFGWADPPLASGWASEVRGSRTDRRSRAAERSRRPRPAQGSVGRWASG